VHAGEDDHQHFARRKILQAVRLAVDGRQIEIGRGCADRQRGWILVRPDNAGTCQQQGDDR
jgi:hypothetical protein